jgi:chromosome segregation ATPase
MNGKMERVKSRIDEIKKEKEELKEKYDYLVEQMKKTIDNHSQDIGFLKNEVKGTADKEGKDEGKISDLRSLMNSLGKSLSNIESKYSILKEKMNEDMKLMEKEINSKLSERIKAMNSSFNAQLKDGTRKNVEDIRSIRGDMNKVMEENEEYGDKFSGVSDEINSIKKSISELSGMQDVLKEEVSEKVNLFEREINSELSKVREIEDRLGKDVEDFEKFSGEQKARMEKFESNVSNKIDMFAVEKENIKRDFTSISNDFKNIGSRLDSLKEKDSDLNQRLQNVELGLDNFKNTTEEILSKTKEEQIVFKENLVAKLNEANEKILNRLSQNEIRTSSELSKQSEDIKLFRAHVTQFVNELVSNYDKRFEVMKSEIDQALRILEERSKEQRAMIFE